MRSWLLITSLCRQELSWQLHFHTHLSSILTWPLWSLRIGALCWSGPLCTNQNTKHGNFYIIVDLIFRKTFSSQPERIITPQSSLIPVHWGFTFDLPVSQDTPLMPRVLLSVYTACFGAMIFKVTSRSNDQMINHLGVTSAGTVENSKRVHDMVLAALSPYKYYWTTRLKHDDEIFWMVECSVGSAMITWKKKAHRGWLLSQNISQNSGEWSWIFYTKKAEVPPSLSGAWFHITWHSPPMSRLVKMDTNRRK